MASGIQVSWEPGPGMEPPPPYAADSFKGWVEYRGGYRDEWQFDDEAGGVRLGDPDMPNGVYRVTVCGYRNGVYSRPVTVEYDHTTGTAQIAPVSGTAPPAGDGSVATPEDLVVTEAP